MAARAYAADVQRDACLTALDTAHNAMTATGDQIAGAGPKYDEAIHISVRGGCHLTLRDADHAACYAEQSLIGLDRSYARDMAMTIVDLSEAYVLRKEIDEAARLLGDAGEIAARNSSGRLLERLKQSRADLQSWADTTSVRQLDDRLATCGIA